MSHPSKVNFFTQARTSGYRTYLYFVATESPLLNIHRIGNRAVLGGHHVPEEKVVLRYQRCLAILRSALAGAHRAFLFDNSGSEPVWLAQQNADGSLEIKTSESTLPAWFKQYVIR